MAEPTTPKSLQETFAPHNACFGCGPANPQGLKIRTFREGDTYVASWKPQPHHQAFAGVLNGGIIGALLDCHCNWASCHSLMLQRKADSPPCTVTAEYSIQLKRPCPTDQPIMLKAKVIELSDPKVIVEGTLECDGKVRATCRATFVAVEPGHPAYNRW
jgi:acyl-coenzyme A thioesterase PaaI-like protein